MSASINHFQFRLRSLFVFTTLIAIASAILQNGPIPSTLSLIVSLVLALFFLFGVASIKGQSASEATVIVFLTTLVGVVIGAGLAKLFLSTASSEELFRLNSFILIVLLSSFLSVLYVVISWRFDTSIDSGLRLPSFIRRVLSRYSWCQQWECLQCHKLSAVTFRRCPHCEADTSFREFQCVNDDCSDKSIILAVLASLLAFLVVVLGPASLCFFAGFIFRSLLYYPPHLVVKICV